MTIGITSAGGPPYTGAGPSSAPPSLRRTIRLPHATAMVVGTIVGASIFVQPSVVTGNVPSVAGIHLVWLAAGALTLGGSLIAAELASAFPRTGGVYVFLREAYSPTAGFLWGWAMFWTMHSGIIAAIAMVFARYVGWFAPSLGSDAGMRIVAIVAIAALSAVNYVGVREGSRLQTAFTAGKLVAVAAIVAAGFAIGARGPVSPAADATVTAAAGVTTHGFLLAVAAGLFAYGGWHMVTYAAGETVDPARTIPRALAMGTIVVTVCYVALNAVYLHVLPLGTVIHSSRVAADAADAVLGRGGAGVMAGLVAFSSLGALTGIVLAGPRVYAAMAEDGLLFAWAGAIHERFRTPARAIVLQGAWSAVLVATGTYRALFSRVVYTEWIFFALMALGLLALRRRPGWAPAYRAPGGAALPILFAAVSLLVVVNQIASAPGESLGGLLLVAAGWPVYRLWVHRRGIRARRTEEH